MTLTEKVNFLRDDATRDIILKILSHPFDELSLANSRIFKDYSANQRITIIEQCALIRKANKKFKFADKLLLTKTGLEQSTRVQIAEIKSGRIGKEYGTVADLCCGIGGDSFFLQTGVIGVDNNRAISSIYQYNMSKLKRDFCAVTADARNFSADVGFALIDPARRLSGSNRTWNDSHLSPCLEDIRVILKKYRAAAVKLRPAINAPDFLCTGELEYFGVKDECLELTAWMGEIGRPGIVTATESISRESISLSLTDIQDTFNCCLKPGKYLYEPIKVLIRSHLFGFLGAELGLWQLDPRIAYLSGNRKIYSPFLKCYKILEIMPFNLKKIREVLKQYDIGQLEIKKRGVALTPEETRKRLSLSGPRSGILVFTRISSLKSAILVEKK